MTSDQLLDLCIVLTIVGPAIALCISFTLNLNRKYAREAKQSIDKYINEFVDPNKPFVIYTTGHPYTWSEMSREELDEIILKGVSLRSQGIPIPMPRKYLINYNRDRNTIHIVFTEKKDFDWDSLKFYDEFIKKP